MMSPGLEATGMMLIGVIMMLWPFSGRRTYQLARGAVLVGFALREVYTTDLRPDPQMVTLLDQLHHTSSI
jgi:hypothetical protein